MTKVITTATIVLTLQAGVNANKDKGIARKAPVTFDVPAQVTIDVSGDDLEELLRVKAVRRPVTEDKVLPPEFKLPKHLPLSRRPQSEVLDAEAAARAEAEEAANQKERDRLLAEQEEADRKEAEKAAADKKAADDAAAEKAAADKEASQKGQTNTTSPGARKSGGKAASGKATGKKADDKKADDTEKKTDDTDGSDLV